jgi:hypothetical protein
VAFQKNRYRNTETKDITSTEDENYGLLGCETVVLYPVTPNFGGTCCHLLP